MTPGFAKPRNELPWLPYGVCDRVIINAHNFTPIWTPSVNGKSPVAAWVPSRDTSGDGTTTLHDLAGSNNGTLTNFAMTGGSSNWVADTNNGGVRALDLDGSNDYVRMGAVSSLASWSISAWIKPTSTTGYRAIFGTPATGPAALYINAGKAGVYTTVDRFGAITVATNLWNHIVVTGGSTIMIYVNNVADSTYASSAAFGGTGSGRLGANAVSGAERVVGRLDDIRLFNQVIDTTDVADLYASGNGRGVQA